MSTDTLRSWPLTSVELTTGALLKEHPGWLLPATVSLLVFAGVVVAAQRIATRYAVSSPPLGPMSSSGSASSVPSPAPTAAGGGRHLSPVPPLPFELRDPGRAESEAPHLLRPL